VSPKNAIAAGNQHRSPGVNFSATKPENARPLHQDRHRRPGQPHARGRHCRRAGDAQGSVQDRVPDADQRINQEYREGNISRGQAHELKQENREIAHETRHDEHTGGYLSHGEQHNINQQENALNRQINRESR